MPSLLAIAFRHDLNPGGSVNVPFARTGDAHEPVGSRVRAQPRAGAPPIAETEHPASKRACLT
ncbi:MAG: hypothetical protein E6G05_09545 [Actinobacteria bacterium]|nr:MAG: hypothetical protein E6G05_09545 [Actinomycetota bacterium]